MVEVEPGHLGERGKVEADVGEFFSEVGEVLAPCGERFADLSGKQPELEWHVGGVEAFERLVPPGQLLGGTADAPEA
ncbi:hypothetical protein [Embleya sp. NPDC050493]|uniref:hypothetical protein n=1 Tax=Embleya sp. NPDC050493 TaxID=3363989 RepID=UPI003795F6DE